MGTFNRDRPDRTVVIDGAEHRVIDLANKLRQFRGRLTRRQMCAELGYAADDRWAYETISGICRDFEILAADGKVEHEKPALSPQMTALQKADLARARSQLRDEIAAHHADLEQAALGGRVLPPYKPRGVDL
jgi:hypothetical protein